MSKNRLPNGQKLFFFIGLIFLFASLFFLGGEKQMPPQVKDDNRIYVKFNTDTLDAAFKRMDNSNGDWGTISYNMNPFNLYCSISVERGKKMHSILCADSIASRIAKDYPHLFEFKESEDGRVEFKMDRSVIYGYVALPTWLLVELIERKVLIIE